LIAADSVAYVVQTIIVLYGTIIRSVIANSGPEFVTRAQIIILDMVRRDFPKGVLLDTISPVDVAEQHASVQSPDTR